LGVAIGGVGTILGAVNFVTTIVCLRAPGMTMFRMPIFTWNILVTSVLILLIFPLRTAAAMGVFYDRQFGGRIYDPANRDAILWQYMFCFFARPEVYVLSWPFFGIVSDVSSFVSRKLLFGYAGLFFATLAIAALSMAVWSLLIFVTGSVQLPFFSFMSFFI